MKKHKLLALLLALTLAVGLFAGCSAGGNGEPPANAPDGAGDAAGDDEFLVGLTLMFYDDPYFLDMRNTVKDYCDTRGWGFTEFDAAADAAAQSDAVENMIASGIDALVIAPVDASALVPSVQKCNELGIPVICVDAGVDDGEMLSFVESDNYEAGVICAEYLVEALGGAGNICITNCPSGSAARDREEGFRKVLEDYPDIVILDAQESVSQTKGMEVADTWAVAYPDIDGVFCIDDNSALGVSAAFSNAGISCPIVSVDGSSAVTEDILNGGMHLGTICTQPILIAVKAMEALDAYIAGDVDSIEAHIQVPVFMVSEENAQDYIDGKLTEFEVAR